MARTRQGELEFANFICKFGEGHDLVDLGEEVVVPAFFSGETRKWGNAQYHIVKPELVDLGEEELGLFFRLVKNTKLEREQIFDGEDVVPSHRRMDSAPSAAGLLILNSHKLIYYPETQYAPSLSELRSTAESAIRHQQRLYISSLVSDRASSEDKRALRLELNEKYPPCHVRIVPLSDEAEIEAVMKRYGKVEVITINFAASNSEIDWDPLFDQISKSRSDVGAKQTKLEHRNPQGLSQGAAAREVAAATRHANSEVKVLGKTPEGDKLRHENDGFSLRMKTTVNVELPGLASEQMVTAFRALVEKGTIPKPQVADKALQLARRLLGTLARKAGKSEDD